MLISQKSPKLPILKQIQEVAKVVECIVKYRYTSVKSKGLITLCFWFAFVNKNASKTRVKREKNATCSRLYPTHSVI